MATELELGLHLPSRKFIGDDWQRIRALGVKHFVDLHWFADRWSWLHDYSQVHARIDTRGPLGDPYDEAHDTALKMTQYGKHVATWRRRNEPNIETTAAAPKMWGDWLTLYGQSLKEARPHDRVYLPAVSPGTPDWQQWLIATVRAAKAGRFDGLDVHAYGSPAEVDAILMVVRALWQGPILMTEYNFGAGRKYDLQRYADDLPAVMKICQNYGVEAVCPFIWEWDKPDVHLPTTVNIKGTPMEKAMASWKPSTGANTVSTKPLWLAIIPSNQDRNLVVDGGNEMTQMVEFAQVLYNIAHEYEALNVALFVPEPESADKTLYQNLWAVQNKAAKWLKAAPPGTLTVALNLHSDAGIVPHVGGYWSTSDGDVSSRLATQLARSLGPLFRTDNIFGSDYSGYIFARVMKGVAAPVLLELGSHEIRDHVTLLKYNRQNIASAIITSLLNFFNLPANTVPEPTEPIDWDQISYYSMWSQLRIRGREEPRDLEAFTKHLREVHKEEPPWYYGWPVK